MPKYKFSYAYDIPCYFDFTVEAKNKLQAERLAEEALDNGAFADKAGEPEYSSPSGDRVFFEERLKPNDWPDDYILVNGHLEKFEVPAICPVCGEPNILNRPQFCDACLAAEQKRLERRGKKVAKVE